MYKKAYKERRIGKVKITKEQLLSTDFQFPSHIRIIECMYDYIFQNYIYTFVSPNIDKLEPSWSEPMVYDLEDLYTKGGIVKDYEE